MKQATVLGLFVATCLVASAAFALPTLQGPTGGLLVPTADIQQGAAISVDRLDDMRLSATQYPNVRAVVGVMNGLEVGGQYWQFGSDARTASWNLNAKYAVPYGAEYADFAVGAGYGQSTLPLFLQKDMPAFGIKLSQHDWNAYLVGTKEFGDVKVTGNIMYVAPIDNGEQKTLYALAAEKALSNNVALGAEFIGGAAVDFGNIYVDVPLADGLTARAAYFGIGKTNKANFDGTKLSLGLTYSCGANAK